MSDLERRRLWRLGASGDHHAEARYWELLRKGAAPEYDPDHHARAILGSGVEPWRVRVVGCGDERAEILPRWALVRAVWSPCRQVVVRKNPPANGAAWRRSDGWTVGHAPSGLAFKTLRRKKDARRLLRAIVDAFPPRILAQLTRETAPDHRALWDAAWAGYSQEADG